MLLTWRMSVFRNCQFPGTTILTISTWLHLSLPIQLTFFLYKSVIWKIMKIDGMLLKFNFEILWTMKTSYFSGKLGETRDRRKQLTAAAATVFDDFVRFSLFSLPLPPLRLLLLPLLLPRPRRRHSTERENDFPSPSPLAWKIISRFDLPFSLPSLLKQTNKKMITTKKHENWFQLKSISGSVVSARSSELCASDNF